MFGAPKQNFLATPIGTTHPSGAGRGGGGLVLALSSLSHIEYDILIVKCSGYL